MAEDKVKLEQLYKNILEEERDVLGDISFYAKTLARSQSDILGAANKSAQLHRAQRDLAAEHLDIVKEEAKLTKSSSTEDKKALTARKKNFKLASAALDHSKALNKAIMKTQGVFKGVNDQAQNLVTNIEDFVTSLPGGSFLSKALGVDVLGENLTEAFNSAGAAWMKTARDPAATMTPAASAAKAFSQSIGALVSPAVLIAAAFAGLAILFMSISKQAKELATATGVTFAQAKALNDEARLYQASYGNVLATVEDINAVQKEQIALLGSIMGANTKIAAQVADMGKAFGYGAEQAGKTHAALMLIGAEQEEASRIQLEVNKAALINGVNVANVQQDIAENSKLALKYISGGGVEMANAALKAAKMGVTLAQMVKVADGLLDIESSLTAQFEFQALSGKQINLDHARSLALNGKIAEATEEVLGNIKSSAEFDKMGRFAKEALAKATGLEVSELAKALLVKEKLGKLDATSQKAMTNLGLSAAEMKEMSASELKDRLAQQQSIDKSAAAFQSIKNDFVAAIAPAAEAFGQVFIVIGPILKSIGNIIAGLLLPITIIGEILNGSFDDLNGWQLALGGIVGLFYTLIGLGKIMAILDASRTTGSIARMNTATAQLGISKLQYVWDQAMMAIQNSKLLALAREGAMMISSNIARVFGVGQETLITAQKGVQAGTGIAIAGSAAATAVSTTAAAVGQTTLTGATMAGAGAAAAQAAAALTTNAAVTFGIGTVIAIAAAAAAIAGLIGYMAKAKKAGDIASPAKGKTQVSTKEGGYFETSKNDDVAAGPGILSRLSGAAQDPMGALGSLFGGGGDKASNMKKVEELLTLILQKVGTPPAVYIGDKAVTELSAQLQINDSFLTTKKEVTGA